MIKVISAFHYTGYALGSISGYEWGVIRGAALTLQAAAAKGLVPEASAAAAVEPIHSLAPGEVQNAECRRLIKPAQERSNRGTAGPRDTAKNEEDSSTSAAKRKVTAVVKELDFALKTKRMVLIDTT